MLELGISVADEALRVRREAERIEPSITSQPHLVQDFGPVEEGKGLGGGRAEGGRTVRDDDARRASVAHRCSEVRSGVVDRARAVVALDRVGEAQGALQHGHVVLLAGPGRRVGEDAGLVLETCARRIVSSEGARCADSLTATSTASRPRVRVDTQSEGNLYRRRNAPKTSACSSAAFSKVPRNESWPSRLDRSNASSSLMPKRSGFAASADLSGLSFGKGFFWVPPVSAPAVAINRAAWALLTCMLSAVRVLFAVITTRVSVAGAGRRVLRVCA